MLLGAFDDECQISLQMENITGNLGQATLTGTGENASITVENNAWKLAYKPIPPKVEFNEYGGIDYVMTIKRKTSYNTINFTYSPTNCAAYFQPPLTSEFTAGWSDEFQCEIAVTETDVTRVSDGVILVHRPDYVVNSIAFNHSSKGGAVTQTDADRGITTGKIGHLYRLKVTDSSVIPKTTWADWLLNGNVITLTIPLAFLQTATYPVVIAPVGDFFGYNTDGKTSVASSTDNITTFKATPAFAGTTSKISAYIASTNTNHVKTALYDGTALQSPQSGEIHVDTTATWWDFDVSIGITAKEYNIAYFYDGSVTWLTRYYDNAAGAGNLYALAYGSFPNPASWTGTTRDYSIYCTYTPTGGAADISSYPGSFYFNETTAGIELFAGVVHTSKTYYAKSGQSTPSFPLVAGNCTFYIKNNGASTINVNVKLAGNFSGGVGWIWYSNGLTPGADQVRIIAYPSGSILANGVNLTTVDQQLLAGLTAGNTTGFELRMDTGSSFSDGVKKYGNVTVSGVVP
jgi:hypothetical protein